MTPIEVIVPKTTANAKDRKIFESNWQNIVARTDLARLDLNTLITHYIFMKLSEQNYCAELFYMCYCFLITILPD